LEAALDCVLLDLQLPDAVGLEAMVRIRASTPELPLIVLTGLDDEAAGVRAVDAGAQDYLIKGNVDGDQLARAIRYSIARRQAEGAQKLLLLSEIQAGEIVRLERGLAPRPIAADGSLWIAARYRAGRDRALLGGDFFDVAEAPDGRLRLVVGDVCGHGPDEAAIGICLRVAWRALALVGVESGLVLPALDRVLEHEREGPTLFTTVCMLEVDRGEARATMLRAGHPLPIVIDGASVSVLELDGGGPPIGLGEGSWEPAAFDLPPEWAILLYTDGITEARVGEGSRRLGEEGLRNAVAEYIARHPDWREDPDALLSSINAHAEELNGGELVDDVAMLMVGARAGASGAA
jgi:serine phosphatase RsbU (regulator of sigma subunit)